MTTVAQCLYSLTAKGVSKEWQVFLRRHKYSWLTAAAFKYMTINIKNMLWIASYPKAQLHKWKKNSPQTSHHFPMQEMTLFHHSHAKCRCFQSITHYWRDGASGPQELADLTGLTWLMWETVKTKERDNGRHSLSPFFPSLSSPSFHVRLCFQVRTYKMRQRSPCFTSKLRVLSLCIFLSQLSFQTLALQSSEPPICSTTAPCFLSSLQLSYYV